MKDCSNKGDTMGSRFVEASAEATERMNAVRAEYFSQLTIATIKVLFDTKLRKRGDKIVLGRMMKANDLIRRLTDDLAEEGCDYILFLDQIAYENIPPEDKTRLVRHELRHCKITGTPEKPRFKVIPHDLEDFTIEVELNKDCIGWASNAAQLALGIYEQVEDDRKDKEAVPAPKKKFFLKKG